MFEALTRDTTNIVTSPRETKGVQDSIEVQIGVLKEVALSLLNQLEVLRRGSHQHIEGKTLHDEVREFEIELINTALARTHGHQRKAAGLLGLKVTTLNAKMKRYNIMSRFYTPLGSPVTKH